MKKIVVGAVVGALLLLLSVAPAISETGNPVYTNNDRFYQFQGPDKKTWTEKDSGECDYWFVNRAKSSIFIYSYTVPEEEFEILTAQHEWIKSLERRLKRYKWMRNIKIREEGEGWSIIEYRGARSLRREKIYLLKGDRYYYVLRLSCRAVEFKKGLKDFEEMFKSFKIVSEETPALAERR